MSGEWSKRTIYTPEDHAIYTKGQIYTFHVDPGLIGAGQKSGQPLWDLLMGSRYPHSIFGPPKLSCPYTAAKAIFMKFVFTFYSRRNQFIFFIS